jgi:Anti-sigma-K factor rskA, C-terminal
MTCEELRPDYLFYALGTLEEPERGELRAHLARGCDQCTAGMREARSLVFSIGAVTEGPEPPRALRARVLAVAGAAPARRWNWLTAWVTLAAASFAAFGLFLFQQRAHRQDIALMRIEIERSNVEAAELREALALIQAPETREVTFGQGQPAPPRGRVFIHPSGVLLVASHLPAPPAGKTYEMWIIRGGKPAPAGLFHSDAQGNAIHLYRPQAAPAPSDVVAVTLETAAGVDAPTSTPIIVAPL